MIVGRLWTAPRSALFRQAATCEAGARGRRQAPPRTRRNKEECVTNPSPRGTYLTISEALRARIAEGDAARGGALRHYPDGLPSEAEIGREFGVARTTVRRALRALEEAGDVTTVAGVGRQVEGGSQVAPYRSALRWPRHPAYVRGPRSASSPCGPRSPRGTGRWPMSAAAADCGRARSSGSPWAR
ncbi:GntR family transcriptional regulator [Streptomyces sp. NPDC048257]|uniref:GntR family transcriptional regulator n=1 Tax=Streptomyces sp. NPDC048257 TaxID=3365526 RepID=UPI003711BCCC